MKESPQDKLLFSVAGARGIVGKGLDVNVVTRLTLAYCAVLPPGAVVVGRDTRPSGASFLHAVTAAVTAAGRECIGLDIATTPTVELLVEKLGAAGGIIVTASHNPAEWNALKFLDGRGVFISPAVGEKLYDRYHRGDFVLTDAASTGPATVYERAAADHVDAILALHAIDMDRIAKQRFKVVLDCINGAGSVAVPGLLEALGVDVVRLNCKTDGDFYRNPEPRPEHLGDLAQRVRASRADLGLAVDPDADRLALVDETGTALSEEYTLVLAVDQILATEKKGPVVVNMSTSALVDWVARQHQAEVRRTPVGEAHVVARMTADKASIGGEGNGGVIYPELHSGRDALVGIALILQLLTERGGSLRRQIDAYPRFHMAKTKVDSQGEFSADRICSLMRGLGPATINREDGVKVIFEDGWCHLRVSNTEGVVRIISESMSEARTQELQESSRAVLESAWGG